MDFTPSGLCSDNTVGVLTVSFVLSNLTDVGLDSQCGFSGTGVMADCSRSWCASTC